VKILIAEDDTVSRRLLEVTLSKWGYDVVACADGAAAWEVLQQPDAPQLVILDWMMPKMDGLKVCQLVRTARAAEPYVYILLLTARSQKTDMIAGLDAGADDYLTKPFDAQELRVRLRAGQRILSLLDELIFAREAMRQEASTDSLTRLCSRGTILKLLNQELARAQRGRASGNMPVSVILADLDHFKRINDTYGHLAGDAVLREMSRRMREAVRPYDGIGRLGGEEFLLVLPDCETPGAVALAERLRLAIGGEAIVLAEGPVSITISIGVATSGTVQEAQVLLGAADAALYRAKNGGRNRTEVATAADFAVSKVEDQEAEGVAAGDSAAESAEDAEDVP
jgi:diguanylate cyclase (GGDEF)-like protein